MKTIYRKGQVLSNGGNYFYKISDKETITICNFSDGPCIDIIPQKIEYPLRSGYFDSTKAEFTSEYLNVLEILKNKLNN